MLESEFDLYTKRRVQGQDFRMTIVRKCNPYENTGKKRSLRDT